jgi:hypothetical protein
MPSFTIYASLIYVKTKAMHPTKPSYYKGIKRRKSEVREAESGMVRRTRVEGTLGIE